MVYGVHSPLNVSHWYLSMESHCIISKITDNNHFAHSLHLNKLITSAKSVYLVCLLGDNDLDGEQLVFDDRRVRCGLFGAPCTVLVGVVHYM